MYIAWILNLDKHIFKSLTTSYSKRGATNFNDPIYM